MLNYPVSFPSTEILEVVEILRSGSIVARRNEFAKNVWIIQGFAQGMVIGEPSESPTPIPPPNNDDFVVVASSAGKPFEKLCSSLEAAVAANDGQTVSAQALPVWLLPLVKQLLQILLEYAFTE